MQTTFIVQAQIATNVGASHKQFILVIDVANHKREQR